MMIRKKKNGFTMIELLVVATIIVVLSMIGVTSYQVANRKSRNARRQSDIEQIRSALELYRSDQANRRYPNVNTWDGVLASLNGYVTGNNIHDPKLNNDHLDYTYTPVSSGQGYSVCYYEEPYAQGDAAICSTNP